MAAARTQKEPLTLLKERLLDIAHLSTAGAVLSWDQEVLMPPQGADARAEAAARLAAVVHEKMLALNEGGLLSKLARRAARGELAGRAAVIARETWRSYERQAKLPRAFVAEHAAVTAKGQHMWATARANDDFAAFAPWLARIVALKREEARLVGYHESPYDALLDTYEPGMTAAELTPLFDELKDFLIPLVRAIQGSSVRPEPRRIRGRYPLAAQAAFNRMVAGEMGFDFDAGRLDESTHPFTTAFHPTDVRITTRYRERDILYAIGSTIHEAGHALYEQGLPAAAFGTPLAETVSMGVHESQSRLWENMVGKSDAFWRHFYPRLQKTFPDPLRRVPRGVFVGIMNAVKPSLIRTEADEVTYNLHIIVRFEIERGLIDGALAVRDLPAIWREKMRAYLGIRVPNDREGVLQDVHWSAGYFGYFPTYALGNLYAAQLFAAMERGVPRLAARLAAGDFAAPRAWLNHHVHRHGKTYEAAALIKRATGEAPTSRYFTDYLSRKYGALYRLGTR